MICSNDTVPSEICHQEPELRWSFILIDEDKNKEQYEVTLDEFIQFVEEKPEWLYQKIQTIHQKYNDILTACSSCILAYSCAMAEVV